MSSEEKIQILVCGDFVDGATAKYDEISKRLVESLGLSVEFLTGDVHYAAYADKLQEENQKFKNWIGGLQKQIGDRMCTNFKRADNGLLGAERHKSIKAMRKGKYKCIRKKPRMRGLLSSAQITWGNLGDVGHVNKSQEW
ncbi:MAG: hypothetical protein WC052_05685 [Patescibacteria group bacterium]